LKLEDPEKTTDLPQDSDKPNGLIDIGIMFDNINNGRIVERTVDCHLKSMESWIATEEIQYLPKFKNSNTLIKVFGISRL
jgi:hypothetical protein